MNKEYLSVLVLALAACGGNQSTDTADSLVANPARLKEVMSQCHEDHQRIGDAECNAASEAYRRTFMRNSSEQSSR